MAVGPRPGLLLVAGLGLRGGRFRGLLCYVVSDAGRGFMCAWGEVTPGFQAGGQLLRFICAWGEVI